MRINANNLTRRLLIGMRTIALFIILLVSFITLVQDSGVDLLPVDYDPDKHLVMLLDVCNQQSSGPFSGLDTPFVCEGFSSLARPIHLGQIESPDSPRYVFIEHFDLAPPPRA